MPERGKRYAPHSHAESLGLEVVYGRPRLGGKGAWRPDEQVIVIRADLLWRQERCTLAHEIQHALAGDTPSPFGPLRWVQESRADRRASDLLVDAGEFAAAEELLGPYPGAIADELDVTLHVLSVWQATCRPETARVAIPEWVD